MISEKFLRFGKVEMKFQKRRKDTAIGKSLNRKIIECTFLYILKFSQRHSSFIQSDLKVNSRLIFISVVHQCVFVNIFTAKHQALTRGIVHVQGRFIIGSSHLYEKHASTSIR